MRVTLVHNPEAGHGRHTAADLIMALTHAGHVCDYVSTDNDSWEEALQDPGEVVVAAGGDGTVESVAEQLVGREVPIAIVPLGTANNLARSLGLPEDPMRLLGRLGSARVRRIDVGLMKAPWGERVFLEAAGLGIFPRVMAIASEIHRTVDPSLDPAAQLKADRGTFQLIVTTAKPIRSRFTIDGEAFAGEWLLVAAMNVPVLGPGIELATDADPCDGMLDVVMVPIDQREALARWIDSHRTSSPRSTSPFQKRLARELCIEWKGDLLHADAHIWASEAVEPTKSETRRVHIVASHGLVKMEVLPGAILLLAD